ncbi:pilin [Catenulispora rubra]|uniref:pilin n=1 Tax=Catenulispora rubra TaxID=280293 RepID=UPI002B2697AA|nr:pilin [Catenulispora rubra]
MFAAATSGSGQVLVAADDVPTVIGNVTGWLMGLLAGLATLMLTVGGVRYVLAAGDPAEVEKAKTCFKSAGIGYCLAVLAPVVVALLKSLVGG